MHTRNVWGMHGWGHGHASPSMRHRYQPTVSPTTLDVFERVLIVALVFLALALLGLFAPSVADSPSQKFYNGVQAFESKAEAVKVSPQTISHNYHIGTAGER